MRLWLVSVLAAAALVMVVVLLPTSSAWPSNPPLSSKLNHVGQHAIPQPPMCQDGTVPPLGWLPLGCTGHASLCRSARTSLQTIKLSIKLASPTNGSSTDDPLQQLHHFINAFCGPASTLHHNRLNRHHQRDTGEGVSDDWGDSSKRAQSPSVSGPPRAPANIQPASFFRQHTAEHETATTAQSNASTTQQQHHQQRVRRAETIDMGNPPIPLPMDEPEKYNKKNCSVYAFVNGLCNIGQQETILTLANSNTTTVCKLLEDKHCVQGDPCVGDAMYVVYLVIADEIGSEDLTCLLDQPAWKNLRSLSLNNFKAGVFELDRLKTLSLESLDLAHNCLTEVVPPKGVLKNLSKLNLEKNRLSAINLDLNSSMPALQTLTVADNQLQRFSLATTALHTSLSNLNLAGNRIKKLDSQTFRGLVHLRQLDLGRNRLGELPGAIFNEVPALETLCLRGNRLISLKAELLTKLSALQTLDISHNVLQQPLPGGLLQNQGALKRFVAEQTNLSRIPETLFESTTNLTFIQLTGNQLECLYPIHFRALTALEHLDLAANKLRTLPSLVFGELRSLATLNLTENMLSQLPDDLLLNQTELRTLKLGGNQLKDVASSLLSNTTKLRSLHLTSNSIRHFPETFFATTTSLEELYAGDNQLKFFYANLPLLRKLILNDNPIESTSGISELCSVTVLDVTHHHIKRIKVADLFPLKELTTLRIAAHPKVDSQLVFSIENISKAEQKEGFSKVSILDLRNIAIKLTDTVPFFGLSQLSILEFGWNGMDDEWLLQPIFALLKSDVTGLSITGTSLRNITLPANHTLSAVHLQNNELLETLQVPQSLTHLNLSGCKNLRDLSVPGVQFLDISRTRLVGTHELCDAWGTERVFARELLGEGVGSKEWLAHVLRRCLQKAQVFDISGNDWLNALASVRQATDEVTVLSSKPVSSVLGIELPQREVQPAFTTQNSPVSCQLQLVTEKVMMETFATPTLAYRFSCSCASGYIEKGGQCQGEEPPVVEIALGSVFGLLALQGLIYGAVRWYKSRVISLRKDHALHKRLLSERDAEVLALKAVWEIDYDQLHLQKRIAAGAYGDVWKGEWDELTVAVKILKQSMRMFDQTTIGEFEKEVEFLQRTRHPHVVRFFGAGTAPGGCPFLVLEYVPLGSLQALLRKDLGQVLADFQARRASVSTEDMQAGVQVEEHQELVVVTPHKPEDQVRDSSTVWDLKLQLSRDIARGMAFIHSLDQFHRDLKSGNVLVSNKLRAKITDFGTIRQRLSAETPRNEAVLGGIRYSQRLGTTTISMSATAGVGTPLYMAPEVIVGNAYGAKADVFSFGVILWEIVTQETPDLIKQELPGFCGAMMIKLSQLLQSGKRLSIPEELGREVPSLYRDLMYECMAQDPTDRPSFQAISLRLGHS